MQGQIPYRFSSDAALRIAEKIQHNLRHLFARNRNSLEKDLSRPTDILGHSDVNTTRIYTIKSGQTYARRVERLNLVVTT